MESYMVLLVAVCLIKGILERKWKFYTGELFLPTVILLFFIFFGFIFGKINGGNTNIALWEIRPFFHMALMFFCVSNLFDRKEHYNHFMAFAVLGILIKSLISSDYYLFVMGGNHTGFDSFTDHAASIQINSVFVLLLASWIYSKSLLKKFGLFVLFPPLVLVYLVSQRRAAFATLALAIVFLAVLLFLHNRRLFWFIIPASAVVVIVFVAAFWNANGMLGLPARTIKSVFALDTASTRDQSSSEYRVIENINTGYTIEQTPLTGVGFGNKFFVIIPLPDISFYEWWNYFPHNSIIYIWVKTGIGGFIAMLFLFGSTIILGTRVINRTQDVELKTVFATVLLYIIMHFVYAYVDIAWDTQSMVYLGACLAILNTAEKVQGLPTLAEPAQRKRKIIPLPIH
jgi:O-antigen ligase